MLTSARATGATVNSIKRSMITRQARVQQNKSGGSMSELEPRYRWLIGAIVIPLVAVMLAFILSNISRDDTILRIQLCSWYSPITQDNLVTTAHALNEHDCDPDGPTEGGYFFVRKEGVIFDAKGKRPPGTAVLCSWYSSSRREYFTTSDPRWVGSDCKSAPPHLGYEFVRLEGYIYDHPTPGSHPLCSWYSPGRRDNFATSDPRWIGQDCEMTQLPHEGYDLIRIEGYVEDYRRVED